MGHLIAALLGKLFADEIKAWLPWLTERLTRAAVRRLAEDQRHRYDEEWRSHLEEVPGELAKTWVALGFLLAATEVSPSRHEVLSRISGLALYVLFLPVIATVFFIVMISSQRRYMFPLSFSDERGEMIVITKQIPIGMLLNLSLHPNPDTRIYWEKFHYASWKPSRLSLLEEYMAQKGLFLLPALAHVILGRISLRKWFGLVSELKQYRK